MAQNTPDSIRKYYPMIFHKIAYSENGILRFSELEYFVKEHGICQSRQLTEILKSMINDGYLKHEKIKGMKRNGYTINEEIISDIHESYVSSINEKGKIIRTKLTQKELSQYIKQLEKSYKREIANKKSKIYKDEFLYSSLHIHLVIISLSWITRLTLVINGGVFVDKVTKMSLARKNIDLLEDLIQTLCINMQKKYPDTYPIFLSNILNYFESLDPLVGTTYSRENLVKFFE